jgi:hypothetical protein
MTIMILILAATVTVFSCFSPSALADTIYGPANSEGATYNITFDANEGRVRLTENDTPKLSILINAGRIENAPIATKSGMVFSGWYDNPQGIGEKIVFPYEPSGSITLYAYYVANTGTTVQIKSVQDLFDIRYALKKNYILTKDLDLGGMEWRPIGYMDVTNAEGKQSRYDLPFEGGFDGNGFKIYNFKLVLDEDSEGLDANFLSKGLFAVLDNAAKISNLTVSDFTVSIHGSISRFYVGGIVGKILDGSVINCKVRGNFTNPKSQYEGSIWDDFYYSGDTPTSNTYIGGIAGLIGATGRSDNEDKNTEVSDKVCYVTNCSVEGSILSESVSDNVYVGGLIGYNRNAVVSRCHTNVSVKGRYAGGLMGYNNNSVSNCFSVATVSGNLAYPSIGGGLIAYNDEKGAVARSYSTGTVTARTAGGLIGVNMFSFLTGENSIGNCYSTAEVAASEYGGGLIGRTEAFVPINGVVDYVAGVYIKENGFRTNLYYIHHCMSFGNVTVTVKDVYYIEDEETQVGTNGVYHSVFAGGLIGHASEPFVASCIAFGDVVAKSERPVSINDSYVYNSVYANNLIGHSTNQVITGSNPNAQKSSYANVYAIEGQNVVRNIEENYSDFNSVPSILYQNANSASYLTKADGLNFDPTIWNLSSLDIENGVLPSLR